MNTIIAINDAINGFVWGLPMLIVIIATGVYFTIRLGFVQFLHPLLLLKNTVVAAFRSSTKEHKKGELSSFQTAMISVCGIIGAGNIAGVASALVVGGPGALFWMIIVAFFGMGTKFAEIVLGCKYKTFDKDGNPCGGTMYYLANGIHARWLAVIFSIFLIAFAYITSAAIDTNTIALTLYDHFSVPTIASGMIVAVIVAVIIFGGLKRIGYACSVIAPFMGIMYVIAGLLVIILNIRQFPGALVEVVKAAFIPKAITGGTVGSIFVCIKQGFARGVFSNEAGLGTAGVSHSLADVEHPVKQAMWGPIEVFLDTVIVCSVTAITIVMSGLWHDGKFDGASLTVAAFEKMLPGTFGKYIALGAVVLFSFSCLIGYYNCAEKAVRFIAGKSTKLQGYIIKIMWIVMILVGSQTTLGFVWDLADTMSGLMIIPNLIGILLLSNEVVKLKKEYFIDIKNKMSGGNK